MRVIVMGMHRSGTSMVTGLLHKCGLYLGNNLLRGLRDNPRGHFEDRTFVRINEGLLAISGGCWYKPPRQVLITERMWGEMLRFVAGWPADQVVGWKDPRACHTIHLWARAIKHEGHSLRVAVVNRSFDAIAASLKVRNDFDLAKGTALCHAYMRAALDNLSGLDWRATAYDDYFTDWRAALQPVVDFVGLSVPDDTAALEAFVDPALRHHKAGGTA